MNKINIYATNCSKYEAQKALLEDGLIAIHGSRVAVRRIAGAILTELENDEEGEDIFIFLSYDHPETELGYIYNGKMFNNDDAKNISITNYNSKFAAVP